MRSLNGLVAVVTGASQGIGAEIAMQFANAWTSMADIRPLLINR
jgi:NAD(P)-dependent dehydrogenase (short-subunit alcohol dehydrogenase family)